MFFLCLIDTGTRGSRDGVTAERGHMHSGDISGSDVADEHVSSNPDARVRVCENVPCNDKIAYRPDLINISSDNNDCNSFNEEIISNLINNSGYYLHELPDISIGAFRQHLDVVGQLALEAVTTNAPFID